MNLRNAGGQTRKFPSRTYILVKHTDLQGTLHSEEMQTSIIIYIAVRCVRDDSSVHFKSIFLVYYYTSSLARYSATRPSKNSYETTERWMRCLER